MQWPGPRTQPPPFPISSFSSLSNSSQLPPSQQPPSCLSLSSPWAVAAWYARGTLPASIWEGLFLTSLSLRGLCRGREEGRERAVVSAFTQLVVIRRQGLVLSSELLEDRAGWREAVNGPWTHAESSDQPAPVPDPPLTPQAVGMLGSPPAASPSTYFLALPLILSLGLSLSPYSGPKP